VSRLIGVPQSPDFSLRSTIQLSIWPTLPGLPDEKNSCFSFWLMAAPNSGPTVFTSGPTFTAGPKSVSTLARVTIQSRVNIPSPHPLEHFYGACQSVIHDELERPLHPATVGELQSFFEHRRQSDAGEPLDPMTRGFLNVGYKVFGAPRFTELYHRWRRYGDMVFVGISSPTIGEAMDAGRGTVECLVLRTPIAISPPCLQGSRRRPRRSPRG
jgi:hypothetical protein